MSVRQIHVEPFTQRVFSPNFVQRAKPEEPLKNYEMVRFYMVHITRSFASNSPLPYHIDIYDERSHHHRSICWGIACTLDPIATPFIGVVSDLWWRRNNVRSASWCRKIPLYGYGVVGNGFPRDRDCLDVPLGSKKKEVESG